MWLWPAFIFHDSLTRAEQSCRNTEKSGSRLRWILPTLKWKSELATVMLFTFIPEEMLRRECLISWTTLNLGERRGFFFESVPVGMSHPPLGLSSVNTWEGWSLNSWESFSSSLGVGVTSTLPLPPHSCHLTCLGQWFVFFYVWLLPNSQQRNKTGFNRFSFKRFLSCKWIL